VQHPGGLAQHKAAAAAATIQNSGTINGEHGDIVGAGAGAAPPSCSKGTPGKVINGVPIPFPILTLTPEACCAKAAEMPLALYAAAWVHFKNFTCRIIYEVDDTNPSSPFDGAVSGPAAPVPITPNVFIDLYEDSCLNGWTMGNIATNSIDTARFFHYLLTAQLLKASTITMMTQWQPFTTGFAADCHGKEDRTCMQYGMGLMRLPYLFKAVGTAGCAASPADCLCEGDTGCSVLIDLHGHLGEDWGSSMQIAGFVPRFNVSVAVGVGASLGMNFSMPARVNADATTAIACPLFRAIARSADPSFPAFSC